MRFYFLTLSFVLSVVLCCAAQTYPLPQVPDSLRTPSERASYVVEHFWDNANIEASDLSEEGGIFEQSFVNFLSVADFADKDKTEMGFKYLIIKGGQDKTLIPEWLSIVEKYLYGIDSPMKNEELYALFLIEFMKSSDIPDSYKIRPRLQLEDINKNRLGCRASDFEIELNDGSQANLHSLIQGNIPSLLIFYDPDCDHCRDFFNSLRNNLDFNSLVDNNLISVIAVYSGANRELWDKTKASYPQKWSIGYDNGIIEDEEIYIIREMPSIYLLDKDGLIMAKEIIPEKIFDVLKSFAILE